MTKDQLREYVRELVDEAGGNGNSEEWLKPRSDALLAAIERLQDEPTADVVRLPVPDSRMIPVSDALERLLSVMRRQGMATLLAACEGFTVRVEPENRTPPHE